MTLGDGRPVTVVGGGVTGLAAALHLHDHGHPVTVLEAGARPGGMLRTSIVAGRPVDEAADAFLVRRPEALDLCRRLDLVGALVHPAARSAAVYADGARHPLPPQVMGVPTDLETVARSGLLDEAGLERLRADVERPAAPLTGPDTDVASEIERRLGPAVLDRLVGPLVGGINAGDPARMSLAAVVPQLDAAARDADHPSLVEACRAQLARARAAGADPAAPVFAAHPSGMARVVDALAAALPPGTIRTNRRAESITGPTVLAVPVQVAAGLLASTPATQAADLLAGIETASVALVTLAVRPGEVDLDPGSSGFLVPRDQGTLITACTAASAKWAHLAPEQGDGTVLLRASAGRHGDGRAADLDDGDLVEAVLADLGRTAGLRGEPTEVRITRWDRSFPQYAPGHAQRMATAQADLDARLPGVAVAGTAVQGVGIPACIASGRAAAERASAAAGPATGAG